MTRVPHFLRKSPNLPYSEILFCLPQLFLFCNQTPNSAYFDHNNSSSMNCSQLMSTVLAPSWCILDKLVGFPRTYGQGAGGGLSGGCCRAGVKAGQMESSSTMESSITMQISCTQSQQTISAIMVCFKWNSDERGETLLKKDQIRKLYPVSKKHIIIFVTKF